MSYLDRFFGLLHLGHITLEVSFETVHVDVKGKTVNFQKSYYPFLSVKNWGRQMVEDELARTFQVNCNHQKERLYTERCFDILNGFELVFTRCINCHKIVGLDAKKLMDQ